MATRHVFGLLGLLVSCTTQIASGPSKPGSASAVFDTLVRATGSLRIIEGRLTGGFAFGRWESSGGRVSRSPAVLDAALRTRTHYSADSHQALIAEVFVDGPAPVIPRLDRLATDTVRPAAALASDLAALHLTRAVGDDEAIEAARALDYAQQALSSSPDMPEALFNRALAFERLEHHEAAERAWADFVAVDSRGDSRSDSQSGWSAEARQRAAALRASPRHRPTPEIRQQLARLVEADDWPAVEALVRRVPQASREYLDDTLLPAWAADIGNGAGEQAGRRLAQARRVADLLRTRHGERAWHDVAAALTDAEGERRARLAGAVLALKEVRALIEASRIEAAWTPLERARPQVEDVPPLRAAVEFWRAYITWYRGKLESVLEMTDTLARRCAQDEFLYLRGRALMLHASTLSSFTRYADAHATSDEALAVLHHIGEREYAAARQAALGFELAMQSDLRGAWGQQRTALAALRHVDSSRRRFAVLDHAVILATRFGLPYAGIALQKTLIDEARSFNDGEVLIRRLLERARLALDLDQRDEARRALDAAAVLLPRLDDGLNRARYEQDMHIEQARLLEIDEPVAAARLLGAAIERLSTLGHLFRLTELHLSRGRALARAGQHPAALDEWMKGIARFEDQRIEVRDEQLKISHFSRAWTLYSEAVAALIASGEPGRALALVERGHARALLDSLLPAQKVSTLDPHEVARGLPEGALVLVYQSLEDELLVWRIDRDRTVLDRVAVTRDELRRLTTLSRETPGDGLTPDLLARLGRILLGHLEAPLARAQSLAIVPDTLIANVPFPALPLPGGTEPLVTRLPVTIAPSLTLLGVLGQRLEADARPSSARPSSMRAAFFADPTPKSRTFLPRLPSSRGEIADSSSVYRDARTFVGDSATEERLLEALDTVEVLHFAGHAVSNAEYPSRSRLLTAAAQGREDGEVLPREIAERRGVKTRLVVLSACSTAAGTAAFGEGVLSLARPFLSAGVPQVVGTLWDIDDRAGRALMPRFHHWYAQGVGVAESLRRAQLELRNGDDALKRDPRTWAAFVLVGGLDRGTTPPRTGRP